LTELGYYKYFHFKTSLKEANFISAKYYKTVEDMYLPMIYFLEVYRPIKCQI